MKQLEEIKKLLDEIERDCTRYAGNMFYGTDIMKKRIDHKVGYIKELIDDITFNKNLGV